MSDKEQKKYRKPKSLLYDKFYCNCGRPVNLWFEVTEHSKLKRLRSLMNWLDRAIKYRKSL